MQDEGLIAGCDYVTKLWLTLRSFWIVHYVILERDFVYVLRMKWKTYSYAVQFVKHVHKDVHEDIMLNPDRGHSGSAERSVCVIQRCNNTFGDRSFAVVGLHACNDLPDTLRNTNLTMDTFCKHLKTVLFTDSWGRGAFVTIWYYRAIYKCPYLLTYLLNCH